MSRNLEPKKGIKEYVKAWIPQKKKMEIVNQNYTIELLNKSTYIRIK